MRSRHTRWPRDWSSAACFSDLKGHELLAEWKAKEWLRVLLRKMSMVSTVMPAVKKSSSYMGPSVSFIVTIVWNRKIGMPIYKVMFSVQIVMVLHVLVLCYLVNLFPRKHSCMLKRNQHMLFYFFFLVHLYLRHQQIYFRIKQKKAIRHSSLLTVNLPSLIITLTESSTIEILKQSSLKSIH